LFLFLSRKKEKKRKDQLIIPTPGSGGITKIIRKRPGICAGGFHKKGTSKQTFLVWWTGLSKATEVFCRLLKMKTSFLGATTRP
jgi:hypothetical protein